MALSTYYLPAEWEPQRCIQLTWPDAHTDWAPYLDDITTTFIELSQAITRFEPLIIAASDPDAVASQLRPALDAARWSRIHLYATPINDTWARDHAPLTLLSREDHTCRLLDFRFNGWGEKFEWQKDNAITRNLSRQGAFPGELVPHDDFVLEGGSIERDGQGTIFTTAAVCWRPTATNRFQKTTLL